MKRIAALTFLTLTAIAAWSQTAVYVSQPIQTYGPNVPSSSGPLPQALWVSNATVYVCTHPSLTLAACQSAPLATYTDSTEGTACTSPNLMVLLPGNTCTSSSGAAATVGFWFAGGTADYWVVTSYGTFGPFSISTGSSSGGGSPGGANLTVQFNNSAMFGGASNVTYNTTDNYLTIGSQQNVALYGVTPPTTLPTTTIAGAGVLTGVYEYGVAFVTAAGVGNVTSQSIGAGPITTSSNSVLLSNLPISSDPLVTGRNIYRCLSGCATPYDLYLVTTINDNTTTTYTDNTADGSLGAIALWQPAGFGTYSIGGVGTVMQVAQDSMTIGANAGGTPGYANTAVGTQALAANNGGIRNVAVGVFALLGNTTGQGNTGIGVHALQDVTTGLGNISLGYTSGAGITTGSSNIAIGQGSLNALGGTYTGSDTVAIGTNTITYAQTPSGLTAIGYEAQFQETTGTGNTSVGDLALAGNTTGSSNTAMGQQAMAGSGTPANNTGGDNTAVGYTSMQNNSSGGANSALGMDSLIANTTGSDNTAAGWQSLGANTTGGNNTAVGFQAGEANVAGIDNTSVGYRAMLDNATTGNTAVGFEALETNVSGVENAAFGYEALVLATGGGNTADGYLALGDITTGANNTALGAGAGQFITGGSTPNQTSLDSVYVGDATEAQANGDTNEDVFGHGAVGNGSNTVTLGNTSVTAVFMGATRLATTGGVQASGTATLSLGTVTVSNAAACAPGATCSYTLTHCGVNASTAIGDLSTGTISAGTSFVINALTASATVATGDLSTVCWKIN